MKFAITESMTMKEISKKLRESGIEYIDYNKLTFSLNEGGYGACVLVEYVENEVYDECCGFY
jgi:type IV pilus biogenesis protein CpaD/CtpE